MMNYKKLLAFITFLSFSIVIFFPQICRAELTAVNIVKNMDDLLRGDSSHGAADMTITKPEWTRTISMETWSEGSEKFFIHITAPAREEGTTFLKDGNLLYQWVPTAEMKIKITPSMMLQPWMGSDFTNDDLVKEASIVNDYTHSLIGTETINGQPCYKIESIPLPDAPIVWGKLFIWIQKDTFLPVRTYFFDEDGTHLKTLTYSDYEQVNDRIFPMTMTMTPHDEEGQETLIKYNSIEFNKEINENIFTLENLEKPR